MSPDPIEDATREAIDGKTTLSRPVQPVTVAIIGTSDASRLPSGTVATTPGQHAPNMIVKVITPIVAILIRAVNLFLTTLLGLLSAAMIPPGDNPLLNAMHGMAFYQLVIASSSVAVAPTVIGLIKNTITVLSGLETKYPLATGSV